MWIAATSLEWLLCYVADEVAFGAVDVSEGESDSQPQQEPNCHVADLHISWDFQQGQHGAWKAEFVAGPLKGNVSTYTVEQLGVNECDAVAAWNLLSAGGSSPTYDDRKNAARIYLASKCATMLHQVTSSPS
jgi:hypothetical protein